MLAYPTLVQELEPKPESRRPHSTENGGGQETHLGYGCWSSQSHPPKTSDNTCTVLEAGEWLPSRTEAH